MTIDIGETEDEIAEDVLPIADEPAIPIKLDKLFPWHKPRKQFVRDYQWILLSQRLLQKLQKNRSISYNSDGHQEIKYLTLPGTDYLDVRLLADLCSELGYKLTSTGFLAEEQGNPINARAQVRQEALIKRGLITDNSQTFWRRLEDIGPGRSSAISELRSRGPFHIVNIDACGSMAPPSAGHAQRIIDALYRIIEMQLSSTTENWMLFVTTDARNESFSTDTLRKMNDAIKQNANASPEFASNACGLISKNETIISNAIDEASKENGVNFLRLFALGLAKWFLHLVDSKNWGVKMHTSYYYSSATHPHERPTMPCLAFEFVPPPHGLEDPFQITNAQPTYGGTHEGQSMRALEKVRDMVNLDDKMASDRELANRMMEKTKALLEEAGYTTKALAELPEFSGLLEPLSE